MFCKGTIVQVQPCAGCVEVTLAGESPGAFVIDNCLIPGIIDMEGREWIGRPVEYIDGLMRFLDNPEEEEAARRIIPFPNHSRSSDHI